MFDYENIAKALMYLRDYQRTDKEAPIDSGLLQQADATIASIMDAIKAHAIADMKAADKPQATFVEKVSASPVVPQPQGQVITGAFAEPAAVQAQAAGRTFSSGDPCPQCAQNGWVNWEKKSPTFEMKKWGLVCDGKNPTEFDDQGREKFAGHKPPKA